MDADAANASVLARLLEAAGHRVQLVVTGELALVELEKQRTDLVVIAVQLTGIQGVEVCTRIRQELGEQTLPIIAIGVDEPKSRVAMKDAGADDFLAKPVHRDELVVRVRNLLELRAHYVMCEQRSLEAEREASRWRLISDVTMAVATCSNYYELSESLRYIFRSELEAEFVGYLEYRDQILDLAGSAGGRCWSEVLGRVRSSCTTSDRNPLEIRTGDGHDVLAIPLCADGAVRGYLCVGATTTMTPSMRLLLADMTSHLGNAIGKVRGHLDAKDRERSLRRVVAQDLAQPTQVLKASLDRLAATDAGGVLDESVAALRQIESVMSDLVDISRAEDGMLPYEPNATHIRKLLNEALDSVAQVARRNAVRLQIEVAPELSAVLDPDLMVRALRNVLLDAIRHARAGGKIEIRAMRVGSKLVLEIANDERAIAPEVREQFQRKFGAIAHHPNVGVGLYFSKVAVAQHGGHLEVGERQGGRAWFQLHIPVEPCVSSIGGPHVAVTMRLPGT